MSRLTVLRVPPTGDAEVIKIPDTLDGIKNAIGGGYLEGITADTWSAYCDEEGKLKGLDTNHRATLLAHHLGWPRGDVLCGDVIFMGPPRDGDETDVTEYVLAAAVILGLANGPALIAALDA